MDPVAALRSAFDEIGLDAITQVLVSLALVAAVWFGAERLGAGLGRDPLGAVARGLVQVVIIGFLLATILSLHAAWAVLVLAIMAAIAASISRKRAPPGPGTYVAALSGITLGTSVVLAAMLLMGALEPTIRDLVPVGSIFIATCMRTASIAFERKAREGDAEDANERAVHASLIPAVDGMRSLGFVWIPGVMTGLILAGASPVRAAFLQFVVVALAFVAAAITGIASTRLMPAPASRQT